MANISYRDHHLLWDSDDDFPPNLQSVTISSDHEDFVSDHDRQNQVSYLMDLFQQRVDHSHVVTYEESPYDSLIDSDFGFVDDNSNDFIIDNLALDFGLGLDFDDCDDVVCQDRNHHDFDTADDDDYFVERRISDLDYSDAVSVVSVEVDDSGPSSVGIVRLPSDLDSIGFDHDDVDDEVATTGIAMLPDSDTDSDSIRLDHDDEIARTGIARFFSDSDSNSIRLDHDDEISRTGIARFFSDSDSNSIRLDHDDEITNIPFPLRLGSLMLDEDIELDGEDDFGWEEVNDRVNYNRDVLIVDPINDEEDDVSVTITDEDPRVPLVNLQWQIVLDSHSLGANPEEEPDYENDDFMYTAQYETLFEQFTENETSLMGLPPASKHVVDNLPEVVISEEDLKNNNGICAVCKDDINVGEKAKQLPCKHHYHGDCIVPWLGIRNTCPVCRHELPTDNVEYERTKARRASQAAI